MDVDESEREWLEREINTSAHQNLNRLFELWKVIGIKNLRQDRLNAVLGHVSNIFATMVAEEEHNLDELTKSIQRFDRERMELRKDLGRFDNDDSEEAELGLVDVDLKIRTEVKKLSKERAERMKVWNHLRKAESELCEATGSYPCNIVYDRLPADAQVRQVEKSIVNLKELRAKRETEFETMRGNICDLYEKLELEPRNTTERHLICDSIDNIALSQDTMDNVQLILTRLETETLTNNDVAREIIDQIRSISEKLKMPCDLASMQHDFYSSRMITKLREELSVLEKERQKHLVVFIKSAQEELDQLWDKCYVGDDTKTSFSAILESKGQDEDAILAFYELHIKEQKKYFEEHKIIIYKVQEWFELWRDRLELETCGKDPTRLGNFRALREEEKKRNRVNKRLPKVVEEIESLTTQYFEKSGQEFLIKGMTFTEMNMHQQNHHEMEVQQEKERKKAEKKKIMLQETIYGVSKTPVRGNRTLRQVKRLQHESKSVGKDVKSSFAVPTPRKTPGGTTSTPARRALRDRNDTFVSGNHLGHVVNSIASVNDNIFHDADVASSTLKPEQLRHTSATPVKSNVMSSLKKYHTVSSMSASKIPAAGRSRILRNGKGIPFYP